MKTGPTIARGKSKQDYPTPWGFIEACESKFHGKVVFDLAASVGNAKADHFFDELDDSLSLPWADHFKKHFDVWHDWLWLNPPFDNIAPWARKCAEGSNWFKNHVHGQAKVFALNGRIQFVGAEDPYPKDCILSAFYPKLTQYRQDGFHVWTWPDEWKNDPLFQ